MTTIELTLDPEQPEQGIQLVDKPLKCFDLSQPSDPKKIDEILPHVKTVRVTQFLGFLELNQEFPGFPNKLTSLHSLEMYAPLPRYEILPDLVLPPSDDAGDLSTESKLHDTLKVLELHRIPLRPLLQKITTLTKFTLIDSNFAQPLDTLLDFLKGNVSLVDVELGIDFEHTTFPPSKRTDIIELFNIQFFTVSSYRRSSIEVLVDRISFPNGVDLKTSFVKAIEGGESNDRRGKRIPTYVHVDYHTESIQLSAPMEITFFHPLSHSEISSVLAGESPSETIAGVPSVLKKVPQSIFSQDVKELHLVMPQSSEFTLPSIRPSQFTALKTLTIENDTQISITLAELLSSPESVRLTKLEIKHCALSEDFEDKLKEFASGRNLAYNTTPTGVLIHQQSGRSLFGA